MIFVWGSFFLYYKSMKETVDPCYDSFGDQPNLRSSKPITSEMLQSTQLDWFNSLCVSRLLNGQFKKEKKKPNQNPEQTRTPSSWLPQPILFGSFSWFH